MDITEEQAAEALQVAAAVLLATGARTGRRSGPRPRRDLATARR
ncbi:hypothetical protein [Streptomyces sp. 769]|nr:hypothetical protein [Streptomyces sp. 769]AJC56626.1 hypothetical protein GZL_04040 [Streptomyces sp. 769]